MQTLEAQILDYLALNPATRAQLARYCGYMTPGYTKGHPFRRTIEKLVADGKIVRKGKYRLTSSQIKANEVAKLDKSAINFGGKMKLSMPMLFSKLRREYPSLHEKCIDLEISVKNGFVHIHDNACELTNEELDFLTEYVRPHILDGEDKRIEFTNGEKEEELEDSNDDGIIRIGVPEGTEKDILDGFMFELLGWNAKLVQSIHLKNDDWEFKISKANIPLRITMDPTIPGQLLSELNIEKPIR